MDLPYGPSTIGQNRQLVVGDLEVSVHACVADPAYALVQVSLAGLRRLYENQRDPDAGAEQYREAKTSDANHGEARVTRLARDLHVAQREPHVSFVEAG